MAVELSGGQFQPPVQTLVATIIFAKAKMQIDSRTLLQKEGHPTGVFFFFL